jgi:cytosine/adenosine deaminase-related metal-dependent hydrolase
MILVEGVYLDLDLNLFRGRIVKKGKRVIFEEDDTVDPKHLILPLLFNAHVHLGDSIFKDPPYIPLKKLVSPPDGLKHRILSTSQEKAKIKAISRTLQYMLSAGTGYGVEFREEGLKGVDILLRAINAADLAPKLIILSRPGDIEEGEKLIEVSDGFGMSSVRDHSYKFLEDLREIVRKNNGIFAIHAGELDDRDVDDALALEPDLLIHMLSATRRQLRMVEDLEIPICLCLRSNAAYGNLDTTNAEFFRNYKHIVLGTDNVMINSPNIFREMEFASKHFFKNDKAVIRGIFNGYRIFKKKVDSFLVMDLKTNNMDFSSDPIRSFVRRSEASDITGIIRNGSWIFYRKKGF